MLSMSLLLHWAPSQLSDPHDGVARRLFGREVVPAAEPIRATIGQATPYCMASLPCGAGLHRVLTAMAAARFVLGYSAALPCTLPTIDMPLLGTQRASRSWRSAPSKAACHGGWELGLLSSSMLYAGRYMSRGRQAVVTDRHAVLDRCLGRERRQACKQILLTLHRQCLLRLQHSPEPGYVVRACRTGQIEVAVA
jgi:hypothetical protein